MTAEVLIALGWGLTTVGTFGIAFWRDIAAWRIYHDRRSRRELLVGLALFLAALGSAASLVVVLLSSPDTDFSGLRRICAGMAWGAFAAAGIIYATEPAPKR